MVKSNTKKRDVKRKKSSVSDIDNLCSKLRGNQIKSNGNAIIYCRVSTQNQTFGFSLDTQMEASTSYCADNNYKIIDIVHEVCSAKEMNKQEKLIQLINSNENIHIIIHDPSRLSRNVSDFTQLLHICETKKITLHFVSDNLITNNNNDIKTVLSSVYDSEIEIKTLSKRVKASIEQRKRNKTYLPSVPRYGYTYFKKIINDKIVRTVLKNEQEQKVIGLINKMYLGSDIKPVQTILKELTGETHEIFNWKNPEEKVSKIEYGNMTFVDIANFLNSIELTKREREWTPDSVSDIINERNLTKFNAYYN